MLLTLLVSMFGFGKVSAQRAYAVYDEQSPQGTSQMFEGCTSIIGGAGTKYDPDDVDGAYALMPDYFGDPYVMYDDNGTLTFRSDPYRNTCPYSTYSLNNEAGSIMAPWYTDGTYKNVTSVVFDPSFANACPTTTSGWFMDMSNLSSITGIEHLNTSEVESATLMFYGCSSLKSIDLSHFDTQKMTITNSMFNGCSGLTSLDLSSFNTAKVTDMGYMFNGCSNLKTIYVGEDWSTESARTSYMMFNGCTSLVGGAGTAYDAEHTDAAYAKADGGQSDPGYLTRLAAYVVHDGNTLTFYFDGHWGAQTGTVYPIDEYVIYNMVGQFKSVTSVVFDPSFAAARPTKTYRWFAGMENLKTITGMEKYLNTSEVTDMNGMFYNCGDLKSLDLSAFETQKVRDMVGMFSCCGDLETLDLSSFNTENVLYMDQMFYDCSELTTIYVGDGWLTTKLDTSDKMFRDCYNLVGGAGTTYDAANANDATYAHVDGGADYPGYLTLKAALKGDVNLDGQVGIGDIVAITNVMAGIETNPDIIARADVNGDDQVGIGDIVAITNIMAGIDDPQKTKTYTVNGVSFKMVNVDGGTFQMGSISGNDNEQPVHSVTLSSFSIGETEVTQELWYAVMGQKPTSDGSQWESTYGLGDQYPAYRVSWNDCQEFITKLNQLTGQTFRLPTEAEWEFAARGGNSSKRYTYAGSNTIDDVAWYASNSGGQTHPVATKQPNELGLYDMSGNVCELCQDSYGSYSSTAQTNPTGPDTGSLRVHRGGSWKYNPTVCRVAHRGNFTTMDRSTFIGFRLAL